VLFFFLEESNFKKKMRLVFSDEQKRIETELLFKNIQKSITNYIGLKSFISFLSYIICFILLYFYQIDSPFLWAICIFIFNFIPVVGPFLAVVLPSFFALIQFENFQISIYLLLFLSAIQLVIGNFLEPKLLGNSLNISPLVALVSLSIWGAFWGVVGMVLSVPFTVIIIILLAHFSSTKSVAIMLSNKGDV
jgi:predicted PurR-regulated permease PerM